MKPINQPPPIAVRKLRKVFRQTTTGQNVVAIDRLDLDIAPREVVAIVGQTGCGKSTLFDLMIGLERPSEGSIQIGDKTPAGDFDYFLKIRVGDMEDFNRIHGEQLIALPGVRQTRTFFVMKEVVDNAPLDF